MRLFISIFGLSMILCASSHAQNISGDQNLCNIIIGNATGNTINLNCSGIPEEALENLEA